MAVKKQFILVIGAGHQKLKINIYQHDNLEQVLEAIIEGVSCSRSSLSIIEKMSGRMIVKNYPAGISDYDLALNIVFSHLNHYLKKIAAIGHHFIYGGRDFFKPTLINKQILESLKTIDYLEYNKPALSCSLLCLEVFPKIGQLAIFDSSFYKNISEAMYRYYLPLNYEADLGIRRYGFYGVSLESAWSNFLFKVKKPKSLRVILCILDKFCAQAALSGKQIIAASASFSLLGGLAYGNLGDIDPAIIPYLVKKLNAGVLEVEKILTEQAGIMSLCPGLEDVKEILTAAGFSKERTSRKFSSMQKKQARIAATILKDNITKSLIWLGFKLKKIDYLVFSGNIAESHPNFKRALSNDLRVVFKKFKTINVKFDENYLIAKKVKDNLDL